MTPTPRGTPTNVRICLIFTKKNHWATFLLLIVWVYLHSFSRGCLPKCELEQNSAKIWTYSSSRSSKVIDFDTNRKRVYDFLLVINSNLCFILHRFWNTATYWLKIAYFSYPSLVRRPRSLCCSLMEFRDEVNHEETSVMGLLFGESCMILTSSVFDWSTRVTDRRTGDSI